MEIVYHIGAPCTDGDRLIKSLLKNRGRLSESGVTIPAPSGYRPIIREASHALDGAPADPATRSDLLDRILQGSEADRLILSNDKFICINRLVVQGAQIWPTLHRRGRALRNLFPQDAVEFHFGIRDPATFVPALFKASQFSDFDEFTENMQPAALRWSETLSRLRAAVPDVRIVVWCNEDTPLIWGELLAQIAGVDTTMPLEGGDDLVASIMEPAGYKRMLQWLEERPAETEMQRRRIVAAFLDKYARDDAIEEEVDAPGWNQDLVDAMTAAYEDDLNRIERLSGVVFIPP